MNNTAYLVTPKSLLSSFILEADRLYFSTPVVVELLYSETSTKLLFVRDPHRGHIYPTNPKFIRETPTKKFPRPSAGG